MWFGILYMQEEHLILHTGSRWLHFYALVYYSCSTKEWYGMSTNSVWNRYWQCNTASWSILRFDHIARALAIIGLFKFKDIYERWEELSKQQRYSIAQLSALDEGYEVRLKWNSWANSFSDTSRLPGKRVVE